MMLVVLHCTAIWVGLFVCTKLGAVLPLSDNHGKLTQKHTLSSELNRFNHACSCKAGGL